MNGQMITNIHEDIVKVLLERLQKNPGKGFYKLYAQLYGTTLKNVDEELAFVSELQKVIKYRNWKDLKFYLGI